MPVTAPAQFLNLDLVLKSASDLSAIIRYLDEKAFVISHHEYKGEWTLVLELAEENVVENPSEHTRRFLALISDFPDEAQDAWKACTSRTFSYGFDGGSNSPALDTVIGTDLLLQIAQIRADIGITVYPFHQPQPTS